MKVELDPPTTDEEELNSSQETLQGEGEGGRASRTPPPSTLLPSVEEVMKKWNMFQFGEVVVPNHPAIPVVPMALQMVYLYPLARGDGGEVRYRMLVPMHHHTHASGSASPPLFIGGSSPSPPAVPVGGGGLLHLAQFSPGSGGGSSSSSGGPPLIPPRLAASSGGQDNGRLVKRAAEGLKASPPLDLTNKSPEKEDCMSQQQRFLESQISLIKIKELELLKNAASATAAVAAAANSTGGSSSSSPANNNNHRCNDCNINFTKYQNYLAHKKYYCSGVKQQQQHHEQEEQEGAGAAAGPPVLETAGQQRGGPPKCKSPRAAAACQERMARELLVKQQEALQTSILAGMKNSAMPLLIPNPR